MVRNLPYAIVCNDKDGGYTLVEFDDLKRIYNSTLSRSEYGEVVPDESTKDAVIFAAKREYAGIASEIERLVGPPGIRGSIMKSVRSTSTVLFSNLFLTCKTHKDPGQVGFRAVHGSVGYMYAGLSRWISMQLRCKMMEPTYGHIMTCSEQLARDVRQIPAGQNDILLRVDIKDFSCLAQSRIYLLTRCTLRISRYSQHHFRRSWATQSIVF